MLLRKRCVFPLEIADFPSCNWLLRLYFASRDAHCVGVIGRPIQTTRRSDGNCEEEELGEEVVLEVS